MQRGYTAFLLTNVWSLYVWPLVAGQAACTSGWSGEASAACLACLDTTAAEERGVHTHQKHLESGPTRVQSVPLRLRHVTYMPAWQMQEGLGEPPARRVPTRSCPALLCVLCRPYLFRSPSALLPPPSQSSCGLPAPRLQGMRVVAWVKVTSNPACRVGSCCAPPACTNAPYCRMPSATWPRDVAWPSMAGG